MKNDAVWYVLTVILSVGAALFVYDRLRGSLEKLLANSIHVPEATTFFLRSFFLGLVLVSLGQAFARTFVHKPDAHLIEYFWSVAGLLSDVFLGLYVALGLSVVLITILVVTLKPNHDK
jgi:hypothetical protein